MGAAADVLRLRLSQDYADSHCWKCDNLLHPVRQLLFLRLCQQEEKVCCEERRLDAKLRDISILSSMYIYFAHVFYHRYSFIFLKIDHSKCKMYQCSDSVY